MALDYDALLLDPIYDALGVDAVLDLGTAGTVELVVLDKTEGVLLESPNNGLQLATSKPAACVRVSELNANSLARADLKNLPIAFNGGSWKIVATQPKPVPTGSGELYLILQQGA
jgi:hypothetical protein